MEMVLWFTFCSECTCLLCNNICLKHYTRHVLHSWLRPLWIYVMRITCLSWRIFHVLLGQTCQTSHYTECKKTTTFLLYRYKTSKNYEDCKGHLASRVNLQTAIRHVMVALLTYYVLWTQTSLSNVLWIRKHFNIL
jgi:hypothetical protein